MKEGAEMRGKACGNIKNSEETELPPLAVSFTNAGSNEVIKVNTEDVLNATGILNNDIDQVSLN